MENDIVGTLRKATRECSDRGLTFAAKWYVRLGVIFVMYTYNSAQVSGIVTRDTCRTADNQGETGNVRSSSKGSNRGQPTISNNDQHATVDARRWTRGAVARRWTRLAHDGSNIRWSERVYTCGSLVAWLQEFKGEVYEYLLSVLGAFFLSFFSPNPWINRWHFLQASEKKALRDWHNLDCTFESCFTRLPSFTDKITQSNSIVSMNPPLTTTLTHRLPQKRIHTSQQHQSTDRFTNCCCHFWTWQIRGSCSCSYSSLSPFPETSH